jgi:hypothetical protein
MRAFFPVQRDLVPVPIVLPREHLATAHGAEKCLPRLWCVRAHVHLTCVGTGEDPRAGWMQARVLAASPDSIGSGVFGVCIRLGGRRGERGGTGDEGCAGG